MDAESRRGKGFGYVEFAIGEHAVRALAALDGQFFQGRILHVLPARGAKPRSSAGGGRDGGTSYKKAREDEAKASASSGHNWNPLFMRADAVGDAMAARYDVEKRDILDVDADASMAVRLARGETQMIAQARATFLNH